MRSAWLIIALALAGAACNRGETETAKPGAAEAYTAALPSEEKERSTARDAARASDAAQARDEAEARGKADAAADLDRQESEEKDRVANQAAR